ncbi:MAG TPA: PadR family transcriptional regulator [Acidimicrobiia bacterium]|nr:PadR family transcriptional regulator [Acidimicrobiia bacterium]
MLDMAVLGLLREGPMHGYELKQRLVDLGFWRISFGSVYPALRRLERAEFIEGTPGSGRRKEYRITADGKEHFQQILEDGASEVENTSAFRVRLAFFRYMNPETRIEFLERRKTVLRVRIAAARNSLRRTADRVDRYTHSLMEHGVRSAEADVAWLDELIASERTHDEGLDAPEKF